jgi:hypothetical protein
MYVPEAPLRSYHPSSMYKIWSNNVVSLTYRSCTSVNELGWVPMSTVGNQLEIASVILSYLSPDVTARGRGDGNAATNCIILAYLFFLHQHSQHSKEEGFKNVFIS